MSELLIVLDTNVIQEDFLMRSGRIEIVLNYAQRTEATFLLPRIVHDEILGNYERELRTRFATVLRARQQLNGLSLKPDLKKLELDVAGAVNAYAAHLKQVLRIKDSAILEYRPNYLDDALSRAVRRQRPCSDRGEEIRDAILWQSILDAAKTYDRPILFISKNTKQFALEREELHPDLATEAAERGAQVSYFPSIEDFAKKHATRIAFITKEWLEEQIDADSLLDSLRDEIVDAALISPVLGRYFGEEDKEIESVTGSLEVEDFFVYDMGSQRFRVEANWWGHSEVEQSIRIRDREYTSHSHTRSIDVRVQFVTSIIVENGAVTKYFIGDKWLERD
jgi:hypothetical protein